ncbi:branched-chain amino acid ABC transporter permease [uncultured Rhodoferax sp.]|uniref:branched-chain amino acid ABC transporter permease n=1 Tax=uncultured Rhodoferax sp. TaxID=223188 RepID=UPI0025F6552C|nr:branched-chain amino acid ABC transporter permease [uncultured Rhodoferax sp.]
MQAWLYRVWRRIPGRAVVWCLLALWLLLAPRVFTSSLSISLLCQMGIATVACLSYNLLMGQGGMLSFGHAVYTGLGAYAAIHALNAAGAGLGAIPVSLIPLVGGVAGLVVAALLGFISTRKAGTPFAMITLGLGELVFAAALMFSGVFGGEGGVSGNRVVGPPVWGISFGPAVQVYYLIAAYTFAAVAMLYAFTHTPLGRMLNAVRDNAERAEFIGYNPHRVRYLAFVIAGFFAGISGGLAALHFEIVTPEVVGAARSGAYLLFTFVGGSTVFFGPVIGAVLMVLAFTLLSEITKAWLLYLGLLFLGMVLYAPGGIASLIVANLRVARAGRLGPLWVGYLALAATGLTALAGWGAVVEMVYHLQLGAALGPELRFLGMTLNTAHTGAWLGAALVGVTGTLLFELVRRPLAQQWQTALAELERTQQAGGAA